MRRIGRLDPGDGVVTENVRGLRLTPSDVLILTFGEVDVRCHVKIWSDETDDPHGMLCNLVEKYLDAVCSLEVNGAMVVVMSVVPPARYVRAITGGFPVLGTDQERAGYVRSINDMLSHGCDKRGLIFFDTYTHHVDSEGMLDPAVADGNVHILDNSKVPELMLASGIFPGEARP